MRMGYYAFAWGWTGGATVMASIWILDILTSGGC